MQALRYDSPRRKAADIFGVALQRAMLRHQVGQNALAKAAGVARSAVVQWRHGRNLPTLETARRVSEALDDERLLIIVVEARTANCGRCGKQFIHDGAGPKRYCSEICLVLAAKIRQALATPRGKERTAARLKVVQQELETDQAILAEHKVAVELMCKSCEPGGYCHQAECPLRPISPLPLELEKRRTVQSAVKPGGAWGPAHREAMVTRMREVMADRWNKPGARAAHSAKMLSRAAARTEEERQEWIQKIKKAKAKRRETRKVPA